MIGEIRAIDSLREAITDLRFPIGLMIAVLAGIWLALIIGVVHQLSEINDSVQDIQLTPVPACAEDEVITRSGECVNRGLADFHDGYWWEVPPLEVSK